MSVNVPKWAGVGAVRYIPDYLLDKLEEIKTYQEKFLVQLSDKPDEQADTDEIKPLDDAITLNGHDSSLNETETSVETSAATKSTPVALKTPQIEAPVKNDLLEKYIEEIKSINNALVEKLQAQDGAFSLGEASDNLVAVKFGMVNEIEDLKNLACQVQDVGKEVEESTRVSLSRICILFFTSYLLNSMF